MPKCHRCDEEIHKLRVVYTKHAFDTLQIKDDGTPETIEEEEETEWYLSHFECPECYGVLFENRGIATEFLKR